MHTMTLVTVQIPPVDEKSALALAETEQIKNYVEKLEKRCRESKDNLMAGIYLEMYKKLMTKFGREVQNAIDICMEPYSENTEDPRYLAFCEAEDVEEDYEKETVDCIVSADGKILPAYRVHGFVIRDGVVYQRQSGPLKHEKRTKKAKRMRALSDYPYKKLYKTLREFAEEDRCYIYNEKEDAFGFYTNPYAFYDWYEVGGRWSFPFLVKNDCAECCESGETWSSGAVPQTPEGYKWCYAARKKDIEWQTLFEWRKAKATESFYELEKMFSEGKMKEGYFGFIKENGIYGFDNMYYAKGETLDEYLERHGYNRKRKYRLSTGAILFPDGSYHDSYEFCDKNSGEVSAAWGDQIDRLLDSIDDDAVVVSVDCHI